MHNLRIWSKKMRTVWFGSQKFPSKQPTKREILLQHAPYCSTELTNQSIVLDNKLLLFDNLQDLTMQLPLLWQIRPAEFTETWHWRLAEWMVNCKLTFIFLETIVFRHEPIFSCYPECSTICFKGGLIYSSLLTRLHQSILRFHKSPFGGIVLHYWLYCRVGHQSCMSTKSP